jgi:hypothetical protein
VLNGRPFSITKENAMPAIQRISPLQRAAAG